MAGASAILSRTIVRCMPLISIGRRPTISEEAEAGTPEDRPLRTLDLIRRRAGRGVAWAARMGSAAGIRKKVSAAEAGADSVLMAVGMRRKGSEAADTSVADTRLAEDISGVGTLSVAGIRTGADIREGTAADIDGR